LTEVDLKDPQGESIRLKRGGDVQYVTAPTLAPSHAYAQPAPSSTGSTPAASGAVKSSDDDLKTITSPMVGTFYASSSPDAPPFVNIGDRVSDESVVCLVEAMKVFNEIKAETSGVIERVLVPAGTAVEFGQKLFLVRPA
jgi:acetyl-CoA carboxylase biotin carboxyl carrier protein